MRTHLALLLALASSLTPAAGRTAIYECTDREGHKTYTDLGCPQDRTPYSLEPSPAVAFAPLNNLELKRLDQLLAHTERDRKARRKERLRHRQQHARQAAARAQACEQAKAALDELASLRRKGYSLAKQAQLDRSRRQLKADKAANC